MQGLTGSPEGISQLAARSSKLLPPLFRLVPGPEATSRPALAALVNLSQVGTCFQALATPFRDQHSLRGALAPSHACSPELH